MRTALCNETAFNGNDITQQQFNYPDANQNDNIPLEYTMYQINTTPRMQVQGNYEINQACVIDLPSDVHMNCFRLAKPEVSAGYNMDSSGDYMVNLLFATKHLRSQKLAFLSIRLQFLS